jgi:hypothetical protein
MQDNQNDTIIDNTFYSDNNLHRFMQAETKKFDCPQNDETKKNLLYNQCRLTWHYRNKDLLNLVHTQHKKKMKYVFFKFVVH